MRALLIGATGATGEDLLELLLHDDFFHKVDIFVRRNPGIEHEKLTVHCIDFDQPEQWKHLLQGDVLFSCLGTTLKAAGSKEAQWKIDYEYQYQFAVAARENHVKHHVLVSSGQASPDSRFYYTRMKGQLEEDIKKLAYPALTIFNPPLLIRKDSDRPAEVLGLKILQFLNKAGLFLEQKPLPTQILAQAMITAAKTASPGSRALQGKEIWKWAEAVIQNETYFCTPGR